MTSLNALIELLQLMVFLFRATIRIITSVHMREEEKLSAAPGSTVILILSSVFEFVWIKILIMNKEKEKKQEICSP